MAAEQQEADLGERVLLRRLPGREQSQVEGGARDGARGGAAGAYKVYEHDPQGPGLGQVRLALPIKIVVSTTEL